MKVDWKKKISHLASVIIIEDKTDIVSGRAREISADDFLISCIIHKK